MRIETHDIGILTPRELQTMALVPLGMTNIEISRVLHCAESTTANRLSLIFEKLGARNKAHAVSRAIFKGVISIHMLAFAMIVTPIDIDTRRAERRYKRKTVIQAGYMQDSVNPYYWPDRYGQLGFRDEKLFRDTG